jgi:hypothetical protein
MWKFFEGRRLASGSVLSAKQLAFLIERLRARASARDLIISGVEYDGDIDLAIQKAWIFCDYGLSFIFQGSCE